MSAKSKTTLTRRTFMASAAASVAPMILPSGVLARDGRPGANDKVIIGHIGIGGMGTGHLNFVQGHERFESGALCDVDSNHLGRAKETVGRDIPTFSDYRKLLERNDLDAVIIAAPDHWHGIIAVQACQAGKDVYVEKPASKTIEEGRAMVRAARYYGRVMQVGSQGRSTPAARQACNYVRNGEIGTVKRVECWHYDNPIGGDPTKNGPAPSELDWNMWLGPARWEKYNPDRVHFNFRWMLDFGGGQIRDRGAHVLSVASWILDLDHKSPVKVTATGTAPETGLWDCPQNYEATFEFEDPELTIVWKQPGEPRDGTEFGAEYFGDKGSLKVYFGDGHCETEEKAINYTPPSGGYQAFESPGHHEDWLNCIVSREHPHMDIAAGHSVASMCILANLSYRVGRPLLWNGALEQIEGDEAANRLLGNSGRGEFHL